MRETSRSVAARLRPLAQRVRPVVRRVMPSAARPTRSTQGVVPVETGSALVRVGVVEKFAPPWVEGWVAVPKGAPAVPIRLQVNAVDVVRTNLADPAPGRNVPRSDVRKFRFVVDDIWDYTSTSDRVRVVVDEHVLPIVGHGTFYRPTTDGERTLAQLQRKFDEGYVFGRTGKLQLSKAVDREWQRRHLAQTDRVTAFLRESLGIEAFFIFGTLLGAVREGGPIGHDSDVDLGYVSKHSNPEDVATELKEISFALIEADFRVHAHRHHLRINTRLEEGRWVGVDLFHFYFDEEDVLRSPYGVAGVGEVARSDWGPLREVPFAGATGLMPSCPEKVLALLYGAGWREPQPGFNWDRDRKSAAKEAWLSQRDVHDIYWGNFYKHSEPLGASSFYGWVGSFEATPPAVLDLGCGDGRDSVAWARSGRAVIGVDRSTIGLERAHERAAQEDVKAEFRVADIADAVAIGAAIDHLRAAVDGAAVLHYLRFLLHSVPLEVQNALLETLSAKSQPGDLLAAEFRTEADKNAKHVHGSHYRRYQNGPEFGITLGQRYGFDVLEEREATGLSKYRDEDPSLYWVVARRRND
jgi:SAM-dependent methyltransferase/predicted nucleotidyltransferase